MFFFRNALMMNGLFLSEADLTGTHIKHAPTSRKFQLHRSAPMNRHGLFYYSDTAYFIIQSKLKGYRILQEIHPGN